MSAEVDAECYLMVDGDDTYPAEATKNGGQGLASQGRYGVGDRLSSTYFEQNKRSFHIMSNSLVRWGINTLYSLNYSSQCDE